MKFVLFYAFIITSFVYGKCGFSYDVLHLIAKMERHPQRDVGYPFIISFNNPKDFLKIQHLKDVSYKKLDTRSIDCLNQENCQNVLKKINKMSITDLDLGAFQINMKWHKYREDKYFSLKQSAQIACSILEGILNRKKEWTWDTLATYHSEKKKFKERYKRKMIALARRDYE